MIRFVVEHQEIYKGYHLVVIFFKAWRNGYIGLPKGHTLALKDYDEIEIEIHGGWTYADNNISNLKLNDFDWYIGFDTGHSYDKEDLETASKYGTLTSNELNLKTNYVYEDDDTEIRTKEYVLNQLKQAVDKLEEKE